MKRTIFQKHQTFRLTAYSQTRLKKVADHLNRHESDIIREAVERFLSNHSTPEDSFHAL
jgi:predicted DNA-binding protein